MAGRCSWKEVNLQIERGEWVGLLGRNGMGKSTLLKLVNGDISPRAARCPASRTCASPICRRKFPTGLTGTVFDIVAGGLDAAAVPAGRRKHWQG